MYVPWPLAEAGGVKAIEVNVFAAAQQLALILCLYREMSGPFRGTTRQFIISY